MKNLTQVALALHVLNRIANTTGITSLTVNNRQSDYASGRLVGTVNIGKTRLPINLAGSGKTEREAVATLSPAVYVLNRIAKTNGTTINSVTIDTVKSDFNNGKIVGLATIANRSRRPFTVESNNGRISLSFMGTKLAA